jgi:hypothetical protein
MNFTLKMLALLRIKTRFCRAMGESDSNDSCAFVLKFHSFTAAFGNFVKISAIIEFMRKGEKWCGINPV